MVYVIQVGWQLASRIRTELVPSWSCSQAVWPTPLLCVQWKTPDDGQRNCPKRVEFYSKNKFEKLVHLVGFITRIWHDARSPERQNQIVCIWCIWQMIMNFFLLDWYDRLLCNDIWFERPSYLQIPFGILSVRNCSVLQGNCYQYYGKAQTCMWLLSRFVLRMCHAGLWLCIAWGDWVQLCIPLLSITKKNSW